MLIWLTFPACVVCHVIVNQNISAGQHADDSELFEVPETQYVQGPREASVTWVTTSQGPTKSGSLVCFELLAVVFLQWQARDCTAVATTSGNYTIMHAH